MDKAKKHLRKMGPTIIRSALSSTIPVISRPLNEFSCICAIGILPFGPIIDLGTSIYHFCRVATAAAQSVYGSTRAKRRDEQEVLDEIFRGFSNRFYATLMLLIRLRLETPVTLQAQFQSGNIGLYWTLTLAFTAFSSRQASVSRIYYRGDALVKWLSRGAAINRRLSSDWTATL